MIVTTNACSHTSTAVHLMGAKFAISIIMVKTVTNTAGPHMSFAVQMIKANYAHHTFSGFAPALKHTVLDVLLKETKHASKTFME